MPWVQYAISQEKKGSSNLLSDYYEWLQTICLSLAMSKKM